MNKDSRDPLPPSQRTCLLPGGGIAHLDGGNCTLSELAVITAVGIADLAAVENHTIVRIVDSTAHHVYFFGGGELHYVFNTRGEIAELWANKVHVTLTPQRQVIFQPLRAAAVHPAVHENPSIKGKPQCLP